MIRSVAAPAVLLALLVASAAPPAGASGSLAAPHCARLADALDFVEELAAIRGPRAFLLRWIASIVSRQMAVRYADRCVHLNQVQVLGTHNSYHVQPVPTLLETLLVLSDEFLEWEYTHRPLDAQLGALGVRQIELDVFRDPDGGLYARPAARTFILMEPDPLPGLSDPGSKVLHVQDLDYRTTCDTLVECLSQVVAWSRGHPSHLPLTVLVEVKEGPIPDPFDLGFVDAPVWDPDALRGLDAEIRSVVPPEQLITPDAVRGGHASLEQAVLGDGWPTLGEGRGRLLFLLDNGNKRDAYVDGDPTLAGRVVFPNTVPGDPDAAFVKVNDPLADPALIPDLVAAGYVVRTRADAGLVAGRTGDTTQREAALASGAQWVSSDFPEPSTHPGFTDYQVRIPEGAPGRCNPVNAPPGCRPYALEIAPR